MLFHILAGVVGYLFGSFPTAYLVVKWKSQVDIRKTGSGNVGTLNSYQVTQSKAIGAVVLLVDLCKGLLAVLFVRGVMGSEFATQAFAGVGAVLAHNFPIWLGFKGGRGLATAAGVMLALGWMFVPLWLALWFIGNKISGDVNVGNAIATVVMLLLTLLAPLSILTFMVPDSAPMRDFYLFMMAIALVILSKLVEPVVTFFSK